MHRTTSSLLYELPTPRSRSSLSRIISILRLLDRIFPINLIEEETLNGSDPKTGQISIIPIPTLVLILFPIPTTQKKRKEKIKLTIRAQ
jgi:hypothetical protein